MSPEPAPLHVLYVGARPAVAVDCSAAGDTSLLTTIARDAEAAVSRLDHPDVDCVVCDERALAAEAALADRLATRRDSLPVVVQSADGSAPSIAADATLETADPDELARLVERVTSTRPDRAFWTEPAFLASVYDGLTELFLVFDADARLVGWNDRLPEVTGRSDAALREAEPESVVTADGEAGLDERLDSLAADADATVRLDVRREAGDPIPFEFTGSAVDHGDETYVCAVGRDVSERVATEAELDEAIADLERSNAELEQFAYVASHDLNEPLRMVSSYLQLLQRRYGDSLDEDAAEFVEFAVDGAERMREMVNALLAYSRVGRRDDSFEPVDLDEVFVLVRRNLAVAIEENDATVEVGALPTVHGDRSRLVELFQNLVANAIRYSGDDPPHVEVSATRAGERDDGHGSGEADRCVLAVRDEGIGIPEDRIDRIFDLFYRSEVHESTGIGLAMAQKIVESHGGTIRVESTPGVGTTFFVELPQENG